jgi:hypothetical protein
MTASALDIAALDCEMIYTTGGFRIARVSIVDASGKELFDELIKMDDGVEVVCVISLLLVRARFGVSLTRNDDGLQGFEHTLFRHSSRRVRSACGTTSRLHTACVGPTYRREYDTDRARPRQ